MATLEKTGLITTKNDNNLFILYPVTKLENVIDLETATANSPGLLAPEDKIKLDKLPNNQSYAIVQQDSGGLYVDI